ncbi:MAG TPA: creatininase family protein, partial [Gemmatimonadales bacterium]|nr:creatininase family protein [Gemmatimonadales bacterium]
MVKQPYRLRELTWPEVRAAGFQVAILPWGATEAHNTHLPYGTDNVETEAIAERAAALAWQGGAHVAVLPIVPFGVQTGQLDIPFCLNLNPSTQAAVLGDLARALAGQGLPKLVILNGHGGNDFRQMIRELQASTSMFLCAVSWYAIPGVD